MTCRVGGGGWEAAEVPAATPFPPKSHSPKGPSPNMNVTQRTFTKHEKGDTDNQKFWVNVFLGERLFWVNVFLGERLFWVNVFLGQHLLGQRPLGERPFGHAPMGKKPLGKRLLGGDDVW